MRRHAGERQQHRPEGRPSSSGSTTSPRRRSTGSALPACRPRGWRSMRSRPVRVMRSSGPGSSASRGTALRLALRSIRRKAKTPIRPGGADPPTATRNASGPTRTTDGVLPDVFLAMGETAENVAPSGISRAEQDKWRGSRTCPKRQSRRLVRRRDHPGTLPDGRVVGTDDGPRAGTTLEAVPRSSRCSGLTVRSPPATAAR